MNKMHRAQILIDPEQHQTLAEIARREGTSISEIVRLAVQEWLRGRQADDLIRKRLFDLEIVQGHRQALLSRLGGKPLDIDLAETINKIREERQDELRTSPFSSRR
jgi:ParB-like chromosome segregation protein Spo0J